MAKKTKQPTQRTLELLRRNGYQAGVVEKWNPHVRIRQDLFGCIDIIACDGIKTLGIQACSATDQARRRGKILAEPRALVFIKSGNRLFVHGWRKSAKNNRWVVNEIEITESDFNEATTPNP